MDIERLRELEKAVRRDYGFYDDIKSLWKHSEIGKDLLKLIDEAIARQTTTSEEVAEAIEYFKDTIQYISGEPQEKDHKLAITALQEYQPTIPQTETTSCEWCESGIDSASVMSADMMMRFVRPVKFCPNCGRRLEEKRHET